MSLARFADGFTSGVGAGVRLGEAHRQGRNARGVREAQEVMSEMVSMAPVPFTQGAIPDGEGGGGAPATGYSGEEWNSMKTRYAEAMTKISDPDIMDKMQDRMAELEKGKVMEYGRLAIAAMKNGDMEKAQNYLAGVSYYTDPGVTPTISVQPDGTTLVSNPEGAPMVLKPENIEDFLHQFVNYEGYRELAFNREQHSDMMKHREQVRLDAIANDKARLGLSERELEAKLARWDVQNDHDAKKLQADLARNEAALRNADQTWRINEANFEAGARQAEIKRRDEKMDDVHTYITDMMKLPNAPSDGKSKTEEGLYGVPGGGGEEGVPGTPLEDPVAEAERQAKLASETAASESFQSTNAMLLEDVRNRRLLIADTMTNPQTAADFYKVAHGLATSKGDLSGEEIGAIAFQAISGSDKGREPFFDREEGKLVMVNGQGIPTYYLVGEAYHDAYAAMFDDVPRQPPQPTPGPNPTPAPAGAIPAGP